MTKILGLVCQLSKLDAGEKTALLSFMPNSTKEKVQNVDIQDNQQEPISLKDLLEKIHNSWYMDFLETFSAKDASLFLSLFSQEKRDQLCKELSFIYFPYHLEVSLQKFLQNYLLKKITQKEPVPASCLPQDTHNFLAALDSTHLYQIIQYLGLYDLSFESKKILEKNLLQKIEQSLSQNELNFIQSIQYYPHPVIFPEMNLQYWNGNITLLKNILQDRGLNRLAKILSKSSPELIWYIHYTLAKSDAEKFQIWLTPNQSPFIIKTLQKQFTHVWDYLCHFSH